MKTLLKKLLPGVIACLLVSLGIGWSRAQSSGQPFATMPTNEPRSYPAPVERPTLMGAPAQPAAAAPVPQYIICGHCGARIEAPQAVWIAAPVAAERRGAPEQFAGYPAGQSFYGIPPVGYVQPCAESPYYVDPYRRGAPEQRFDLPSPRRIYR